MDSRKSAVFLFKLKIPFLGSFGLKYENNQVKLKIGTQSNLDMRNWMVIFNFSIIWSEIPFLGKFGPKNQNCPFKLKFGT